MFVSSLNKLINNVFVLLWCSVIAHTAVGVGP